MKIIIKSFSLNDLIRLGNRLFSLHKSSDSVVVVRARICFDGANFSSMRIVAGLQKQRQTGNLLPCQ